MLILTTVQQATAVDYCVYANVLSPKEKHLVLAKDSSLEVYSLEPSLSKVATIPLHVQITSLTVFRPAWDVRAAKDKNSITDWLYVTCYSTLRGASSFVLTYVNERFLMFQDWSSDGLSQYEVTNHQVAVDPSGEFLAVHYFMGYVKLLKVRKTVQSALAVVKEALELQEQKMESIFHSVEAVNLSFTTLIALAFVPGSHTTTLAVVHQELDYNLQLELYAINNKTNEPKSCSADIELPASTSLLIPIAKPTGGVLAVSPSSATYVAPVPKELRVLKKSYPLHCEESRFTCWSFIDHSRIIIGSESGGIYLLVLHFDLFMEDAIDALELLSFGHVSPFTSIEHLSGDYFFGTSRLGNATLFKLNLEDSSAQIVQDLDNVAPITDMCLKKGWGSTRSLFVGSGTIQNGVMKRINFGYVPTPGLEIDYGESVVDLWNLPGTSDFFVTTAESSNILTLSTSEGEVRNEKYLWFDPSLPTIAVDVLIDRGIQVTSHQVRGGGMDLVSSWTTQSKISAASSMGSMLFLVCGYKNLVVLDDDLTEVPSMARSYDSEISTLKATNFGDCIIALWSGQVIVEHPHGTRSDRVSTTIVGPIRRIFSLGQLLVLCSATGDVEILEAKGRGEYTSIILFSLGTDEVIGEECCDGIVLSCERTVLIDKDANVRLLTLDKCDAISGSEDCIVTAHNNILKTYSLPDKMGTAIECLKINEMVVKIEPFNIIPGTIIFTTFAESGPSKASKVRLAKSDTTEILAEYALQKNEIAQAISTIETDAEGFNGFVVGTAIENGSDSPSGRLLLFTVNQDDDYELVVESTLSLPGCVMDITFSFPSFSIPMTQFLVSIHGSESSQVRSVQLKWEADAYVMRLLDLEHEFESPSVSVAMESENNTVVIGDLLSGMSIATFNPSTSLKPLSGSLEYPWLNRPQKVLSVGLNGTLAASCSADGLLMTTDIVTKMSSYIHLHSQVNKFVAIDSPRTVGEIKPLFLMGTVNGGIYLLCDLISEELVRELDDTYGPLILSKEKRSEHSLAKKFGYIVDWFNEFRYPSAEEREDRLEKIIDLEALKDFGFEDLESIKAADRVKASEFYEVT
ncbi:hypothetical protein TRVA0_001S02388 [Trichomonascus vanleenenianus]|uniref:mono-functional DNA-alkylating methyl methanesulfonate N-terminal domain-containing protein n=1 Tax=Trichomonascus vanleenenianus TaxID=2268995 RepID=UPI003ECB6F87